MSLDDFLRLQRKKELVGGPRPRVEVVVADITERDRQAAKNLISKYNLHPSDEDKIAAMIAARIADGDIGQFIADFVKLKKPRNTLSWLSDETDEERKRRESLKAERQAERRNKKTVEWKPTPPMTREQIAKLVVGQEVGARLYGPLGCKGKVIKITDDGLEVQASDLTIYRFDKDGVETSDSRRQRIVSTNIEEEFFTGDWHLFPEVELMHLEQESPDPYLWVPSVSAFR